MTSILHVGKYYHPHPGGVETVLQGMARSLAAYEDITIKVLVYNDTPRTVRQRVDGIDVLRLGSWATVASQAICPSMPYWLRRQKTDLINLHLPNPLAGLSCLLARVKCPIVVTYHADIVRQKYLLGPYLFMLNRILRRADRIVVATPNHIKFSRILPRYEHKCTVIPFGIDLARWDLSAEIEGIRDRIRTAQPGSKVLFIGRLVYYKGLEYLIRAMKTVDARLVIIGTGPLAQKLRTLTDRLELAKRIDFLGHVAEQDKIAYLHACDLLVLPSVEPSEAFGMTQVEAMACSKPVVSTNLPSGVPYVNVHGRTGLVVEPRDSKALADAINLLLGDAELRRRLGGFGRTLVEREYTEQVMGRRYRELYADILGGPRIGSGRAAPMPQMRERTYSSILPSEGGVTAVAKDTVSAS